MASVTDDPASEYEFFETASFRKQKEDYKKKYLSLPGDIELFKNVLRVRPDDGSTMKSDGNPAKFFLRKSRMACKSLGRGQSGSFRVFYIQDVVKREIHLIALARRDEEGRINYKELHRYLDLLGSEQG